MKKGGVFFNPPFFLSMRQFQNVPFFPISASPMSGICQQAEILILEILNVWMPVPLYLSGVVKIFAFPRSKSGIFDLISNR